MNPRRTAAFDRRAVLGAGLGVLAGGALSGCIPGPATVSRTSTSGDFSFVSWSLADDASKAAVQKPIRTFEKRKGLRINPMPFGFEDYLNQVILQVRGGQFSGAVQLDIAWLSALARMGNLRDLGPYARGAGYTEIGLRTGRRDEVQYGLPWSTAAIGLIGNRELLERAGLRERPQTIQDFEAALTELAGLGRGVVPYAASTHVDELKDIMIWMETFGSPLVDEGRIVVGDDPSIEAVAWYKRLYDKGLIAADVNRADARNLFSQGKAALFDDAVVGKSFVVGSSPDSELLAKLDPVPRPVLKMGDTPRAQQWGHIVLVVDGEGADSAAEFARWLTSDPAVGASYFEETGLPPATERGLSTRAVEEDEFTSSFDSRITATATPSPFWPYPKFAQMEMVVAEQVQAVLTGGERPQDAMREAGEILRNLV